MYLPTILINKIGTPSGGMVLMNAIPTDGIENRRFGRRFYDFNMIITKTFDYQDTSQVVLTDNNSEDEYHLVDRLGNPVLADQLRVYAANRRCLRCRFDSVRGVIRVLSCICPTECYIQGWCKTHKK